MASAYQIATFERVHPQSGTKQQREAYTPTEAVNLRADGWVEKPAAKPTEPDKPAPGVKPANK